ncbi:Zinc uptake regulation protein ZUR [Anaerovibrio sp. JC8]|uniref:Fur family transcriptional regulator n=1 Tax=Anaerovibrio sp. JC8 TaxID=1240085 RepID=UPI000A09DAD5|nr:Fur family transcriptional regulator [Anaerovibrio sp. JC8]ORT99921.1 Zinc uptake regulation protein ZUR [Anaerovibrio sp. JC8]
MTEKLTPLDRLRAKGYKITPQRRAVLQALAACPPFTTAQQIREEVQKQQPDVSLDTVYRNLSLLAELDIVHEIFRSSGNVYELVDDEHHHHHLVCTECGRTECIDICPMIDTYEQEAAKKGFQITGHIFELYGLCSQCQEKKSHKK